MSEPNAEQSSYRLLTDHALIALRNEGWEISKAPGHGRSNVWRITRGDEGGLVSIRTTKDRWIAYQPQEGGKKWKTLDTADYVCISAVSYTGGTKNPDGIDVHLIDAQSVRDRFDSAYKARTDEGHTVTNDFGMWVCMDHESDSTPYGAGSGVATEENRIARFEQFVTSPNTQMTPPPPPRPPSGQSGAPKDMSVKAILERARLDICVATGLPYESISLELNLKG